MKRQLPAILTVLAIIILGVFVGGLLRKQKEPMERRRGSGMQGKIPAMEIRHRDVRIPIAIKGHLRAYDRIELFAEVSGVLESTGKRFLEGQRFQQGEILIQINRDVFESNLLAQRSQLLNQITLLLPDLSMDFPDRSDVWEKYLSQFRIDAPIRPLPDPGSDKEKYYIAGRNIYTAYYNIRSMEATLRKYTLRAPFSGAISSGTMNPGTLVRQGQKLGEFVKTGFYELAAAVPTILADHLALNEKVVLHLDAREGTVVGRIVRIGPSVNSSTGSIRVFVRIEDSSLKENMFLSGEVLSRPFRNVSVIGRDLVQEGDRVFAFQEDRLVLLPVQKVVGHGDRTLVRGLPEGTLILAKSWKEARSGKTIPRERIEMISPPDPGAGSLEMETPRG